MKQFKAALLTASLIILAACAPAVEPQPVPGSPAVIYNATVNDVYGEALLAIATADGLPESNGWIIQRSDLAGGFVETQTYIRSGEGSTESLLVSLYPVGQDRTGVIIQRTFQARGLATRISNALLERFGAPVASEQVQVPEAEVTEEEDE